MSYAPVADLTFSVDEGRTTSAEPFSQWSQCECPTSGPERWFPGTFLTQDGAAVFGCRPGRSAKIVLLFTVFFCYQQFFIFIFFTNNTT